MLPWLSSLTVGTVPAERLRHRWSPRDYRISPLPREYPRPLPVPRHAVSSASPPVFWRISQRTYMPGYGPFRPNNRAHHLGRRYYRGGWQRSCPPLIPPAIYTGEKPPRGRHWEYPPHACAHWEGFAPAAPRRAWTRVSVSISGLPLSGPVRIVGLVGRYPTNYLIRRSPILGRPQGLSGRDHSRPPPLWGISLSFPRLSPTRG